MKVRVKKYFRDKDKKRVMTPGFITEYEEARAIMLKSRGYVEILEEKSSPEFTQGGLDVGLKPDEHIEKENSGHRETGDNKAVEDAEKEELKDTQEKVEVPTPSKTETAGLPSKRGRKPKN